FETITPYKAGDSFVSHRIYMGDKETVDLGILEDTPINIPRGQSKNLEANFKLEKNLQAPLAKGEVVGTLYLQIEGEDIAEYPLVALQEVNEGGFIDRMIDFVKLKVGLE
ncbi:MAG: D-alanyl-D-alanine carboxypeptidase, partial [Paraglaciecola sp.]